MFFGVVTDSLLFAILTIHLSQVQRSGGTLLGVSATPPWSTLGCLARWVVTARLPVCWSFWGCGGFEIIILQLLVPAHCPPHQLLRGLPICQVLVVSFDDEQLLHPDEVEAPVF